MSLIMHPGEVADVQNRLMTGDRFQRMGLVPMSQRGGQNWLPTTCGTMSNVFGANLENLRLPSCHNQDILLLMADRWTRSDAAHTEWAARAKMCVDFAEGRQWTADEMRRAEEQDRPILTHNKIGPLVRLVLGYHRNNRYQTSYAPTDDSNSTQDTAEILGKIDKRVSQNNHEAYVDTEVFMDGTLTGRSYYDYRLSFEHNDFGDLVTEATDPFTLRLDPDSSTYDPGKWGYTMEARWWSIDEIEYTYGCNAAALLLPFIHNGAYRGGIPGALVELQDEITPWRNFGGGNSGDNPSYMPMEAYIANSIDPLRKTIRLIDCQHMIRVMQYTMVNLESGDRTPIPDQFGRADIEKMLAWAQEHYAARGKACPIRMTWRPAYRVRWTTIAGDLIVHDDWSPYRSLTKVPFFPWFRRGFARGIVEDLLDPQRGINRVRSAWVDTLERSAHSGWMFHESGMREEEKQKLERYGAAPGINIEWKGNNPAFKPEKIQPSGPPTGLERLEQRETDDLKEISGINDSALGQMDSAQSGRAIEARQRQSVLGIEPYMDNYKRTKELCGEKKLEIYQQHYTEERLFLLTGEGGKDVATKINYMNELGQIVNNVTLGKYCVQADETPLTATFLNAQMEEMMDLVAKGVLPVELVQDIVVDLSTIPSKELVKTRINALLQAKGMMTIEQLVAAVAQNRPVQPGQIPQAPVPPAQAGSQAPPARAPNAEGGTQGGANSAAAMPVPPGAQAGTPAPAAAPVLAAAAPMY